MGAAERGWVRRHWPALAFALVVAAVGLLFGAGGQHASAAPGTPVCGQLAQGTMTWTAAGSPYLMCPGGVTVPQAATLNLDGSGGPVQVRATGSGGLSVLGGTLHTMNTGATARVSFDGPIATRSAWDGISIDKNQFGADETDITLSYVDIAHAKMAVHAQARTVALDHLSVSDSGVGVLAGAPV